MAPSTLLSGLIGEASVAGPSNALHPTAVESSPAALPGLLIPSAANLIASDLNREGWLVQENVTSLARDVSPLLRVSRWTSPTGETLESVRTRTDPPFEFAYHPFDDDQRKMLDTLVLEPALTRAWHEATWECCAAPGGLVVDVGGNFGWYTLYSVALGCDVVVFEPVPAYQEIIRLGLSLNPGFAKKVTLFGNVVYDKPGVYSLNVPEPRADKPLKLGMTGMDDAALSSRGWGLVGSVAKHDVAARKQSVVRAAAVRIDDIVRRDVCLLKADVEGFEPQVMQTAASLLALHAVPAVQFELTHTSGSRNQTCAAVHMLSRLAALGFELRQSPRPYKGWPANLSEGEPPHGAWRAAESTWAALQPFPQHRNRSMRHAYEKDFWSFSTNIVARRPAGLHWAAAPPWPLLDQCEEVPGFAVDGSSPAHPGRQEPAEGPGAWRAEILVAGREIAALRDEVRQLRAEAAEAKGQSHWLRQEVANLKDAVAELAFFAVD